MEGFVLLSLDPFNFLRTRSLSQTNISSHLLLDSLIDRPTRILKDYIYHRENTNKMTIRKRLDGFCLTSNSMVL